MSTNIYFGSRIDSSTNPISFLAGIRGDIDKFLELEISRESVKNIVRKLDDACINKIEPEGKPYSIYSYEINHYMSDDGALQLSTRVFFRNSYTYFIVECAYPKFSEYVYNKMLENGAEDFSYWDNSERPESIDEKQWEDRAKVWNSILYSGSPISHTSLVYDLSMTHSWALNGLVNMSPREQHLLQQSRDERLQDILTNVLYSERVRSGEYDTRSPSFISTVNSWVREVDGAINKNREDFDKAVEKVEYVYVSQLFTDGAKVDFGLTRQEVVELLRKWRLLDANN